MEIKTGDYLVCKKETSTFNLGEKYKIEKIDASFIRMRIHDALTVQIESVQHKHDYFWEHFYKPSELRTNKMKSILKVK